MVRIEMTQKVLKKLCAIFWLINARKILLRISWRSKPFNHKFVKIEKRMLAVFI